MERPDRSWDRGPARATRSWAGGPWLVVAALWLGACGSSGGGSPEPPSAPTPAPGPTPTAAPAPAEPPSLRLSRVASGLAQPVYAVSPPEDPRLFVLEQVGRIRIVDDRGVRSDAFLDLTDEVGCCGERGLLGLAFHPDYSANGRFFVNYTDRDGNTVVAEYARSPDEDDRASPEEVRRLLYVEQPFANHNGGMIDFGPDGVLWAGFGDGGAAGDPRGNGQNASTKLGALLRIDVDTHPEPPDGNWIGGDPDVWAIGLRNPWRFSFDRVTGDLYVGDVGQDRFEEVHVTPAGAPGENYGWNVVEGTHCFSPRSGCDPGGLALPVVEYGRDLGRSVTGGYVYRGEAIGDLRGWYLYGDFASNRVWALRWEDGRVQENVEITDDLDPDRVLAGISSFGQDASGEVYVVSYDGAVYRIDPE